MNFSKNYLLTLLTWIYSTANNNKVPNRINNYSAISNGKLGRNINKTIDTRNLNPEKNEQLLKRDANNVSGQNKNSMNRYNKNLAKYLDLE